jgi:hypothetical protein
MMRIRLILGIAALAGLMCQFAVQADEKESSGIVVDKDKRTVTVNAKIAPRKIDDPRYKEIYPIEVIACWPFPKGQKAHETVITIDAKPSAVHKALVDLGLKPGKPVVGAKSGEAQGPEVGIFLQFKGPDDQPKKVPIEQTLIDPKTGKKMPKVKWRFTGSIMKKVDPTKDEESYAADQTGTLVSIFPVTNETVFQTNLLFEDEKYLKLETDKKLLPKEGEPAKLIIEVPAGK